MLTLAETSTLQVLLLIGLMIAVVFLATVAIMIFRKKVLNTGTVKAGSLLMDDFRRLHASGKLSDAEFQQLKSRLAAKMMRATTGEAPRAKPSPEDVLRGMQVQQPQRSASPGRPRPPAPPPPPARPS